MVAPFFISYREIRMENIKRYTEEEAGQRLAAELSQWSVSEGHLCRQYETNGWRASMLLANGIAHLAEVAWHHPDLAIGWGSVNVRLRTHDADAITDKDFDLAIMIEQTACWRPTASSSLDGPPSEGQWRYLAGV